MNDQSIQVTNESRKANQRCTPERTGWRDQRISERHRQWGAACRATDLDFLLLEYSKLMDGGIGAVALIEYKHEKAPEQYLNGVNYQALINLGNRAQIPVFVVRYTDNFELYKVTPLNLYARKLVTEEIVLKERNYIRFLHILRGIENLNEEFFQNLGIKV